MSKKPKILQQVTIDKIGYGGIGLGRHTDGRKVLVQGGVLPGSVVDVIVTKSKKDFFEGRVFFIHTLSKEFATREAPCPHYFAHGKDSTTPLHKTGCGGCKWQQVQYDKQLQLKMDIVMDSFRSIKEQLEGAEIRDILPSPDEFGYRNKIEYSFGDFKSGDIHNKRALGFHKQGQFSQIIDVDECLLVSDTSRKLFHHFKNLCQQSGLPIYNQVKHRGVLRHLVIREGVNTGQFLVNLSIADTDMDEQQQGLRTIFQETLKQDEFIRKHVTTLLISHNNGLGDAVFTHETIQRPLWGEGYMYEKLIFNKNTETPIEATFKVSANSFFQTNTYGAEILFGTAASMVGEVRGPLIDLYCGAGSIGISCNKLGLGDSLYGIEIVPDAITDAQHNATINNISSSYFVAGKAEQLLDSDETFTEVCNHTECIVVDPPRDGLHKNVIQFLRNLRKQKPYKLLYISCNPVTLARDIGMLSEAGLFKPRIIQPVDMFPHTHHIEIICLIS